MGFGLLRAARRGYGVLFIAVSFFVLSTQCRDSATSQGGGNPVADKIKAGALVVDVRTPGEFAAGHYPGAVNIPVEVLPSRLAELPDKQRSMVLYCRSGNRSGQALRFLQSAGYSDVINAGSLSQMPTK